MNFTIGMLKCFQDVGAGFLVWLLKEQDESYKVFCNLAVKVKFKFYHFHNILLFTSVLFSVREDYAGLEYPEVRII